MAPRPWTLTAWQLRGLIAMRLHAGVPPAPQTTQEVVELQRKRDQR
jgi:hypothetical protein